MPEANRWLGFIALLLGIIEERATNCNLCTPSGYLRRGSINNNELLRCSRLPQCHLKLRYYIWYIYVPRNVCIEYLTNTTWEVPRANNLSWTLYFIPFIITSLAGFPGTFSNNNYYRSIVALPIIYATSLSKMTTITNKLSCHLWWLWSLPMQWDGFALCRCERRNTSELPRPVDGSKYLSSWK